MAYIFPLPLSVDVVGDLDNAVWVDPGALAETAVSYVGATKLLQVLVTSAGQVPYYVQVFDRAIALVGGETPNIVGVLPAAGTYSLTSSRAMVNGIVWAISTTLATYTAPGVSEAWTNIVHQTTP